MERTWLSWGIVLLLGGRISAQEVNAPVPVASADAAEVTEATYVIQMKILEGNGLIEEGEAQPAAIGLENREWHHRRPPGIVLASPTAEPMQLPELRADEAEIAADSRDAGIWEKSWKMSGIEVLSEPTVAVLAGQPSSVEIKSLRVFSYLEPLGEGKFQLKHTPPHQLGMEFSLGVQPVAGDERFVDVSPLEVDMSMLDGREPVEGIDLDVGRPIVATRSLSTTARLKLGATRMVALPSGPHLQAILLLRVSRMGRNENKGAETP